MPAPAPVPRSPGLITRVARGLRTLARRGATIQPGQYYGSSLTTPVLSGIVVTPQTAMQFMAVYSAINTISTDVAKLPRRVMEHDANGSETATAKHPNYKLFRRPNPEMNGFRYFQTCMGHTLGWGNHYSEIVRNGEGQATALWPMNPGTTKPRRDERTKALYYEDTNTGKRYLPENILHFAGLGFDGIQGYSPITNGRQAVGLGIAAEQFGASFFGNGAVPRGLLKHAKRLSEVAAKRLRESWELVHGGTTNANRLAVLEDGLEWVDTQIAPEAAQFLATRMFQVIEICRMFNIPPHKLMDYSQAHLANVEESNQDYLDSTLSGWLATIEEEINAKLFFEDELERYSCQHDIRRLLRANTSARTAFYQSLKQVGAINADTIAGLEGLPIPGKENGGNLYLVQSQNIPQQNAGKPQPKPAKDPATPSVQGKPPTKEEPGPEPVDDPEEQSAPDAEVEEDA
jgi:HK97 family phage portal protein